MKRFTLSITAAALLLLGSVADASSFREFTDTAGRTSEFKLTRVSGDDVSIEMRNGQRTTVKIDIFSKADQDYIREWGKKAALSEGVFEVRFTEEEEEKKKGSRGGIAREEYTARYGIVLRNASNIDVSNIKVEYLMTKFEDAMAAQKRSEGENKRQKGTLEVGTLSARSDIKLVTEAFPMLETKLEPGYSWSGGGKKTSKDKLTGIWIKVYADGSFVQEFCRPENMSRNEVW